MQNFNINSPASGWFVMTDIYILLIISQKSIVTLYYIIYYIYDLVQPSPARLFFIHRGLIFICQNCRAPSVHVVNESSCPSECLVNSHTYGGAPDWGTRPLRRLTSLSVTNSSRSSARYESCLTDVCLVFLEAYVKNLIWLTDGHEVSGPTQ